jgi:CheY-like chemotaxis protein
MLAYSGKGRFVVEHIDLTQRVRDTLPLIRAAIPPNVEMKLDLAGELPPVEADASQIQQVVMNIIINGAEAIPEGKRGTVTIRTRLQKIGATEDDGLAAGSYVVFEVTDTGVGMDEETKSRIFDPFFTTKFTGRGLGLAAVLGIVRGHRGSIHVSSSPGEGATFRVLLPAVQTAPAAISAPGGAIAEEARDGGVVLVVDDEQMVRSLAKNALERHGFTVLLAENGARGLDVFQQERERIQCVVLDLTMPVMNGEEALARMKAVRPCIPVLLSSGFNEAEAVRRFEGKGLAGFLQKPYKAAGLVEKVRAVLAAHSREAV